MFCEICILSKQKCKPHVSLSHLGDFLPGEKIHSDLCGPVSVESYGSSRYFIVFKDQATSFRKVYFLRFKSEALDKLKDFEAFVFRQTKNKIKVLRSDKGKEYYSKAVLQFTTEKGIIHEFSSAYIHEQNGRAEREIQNLLDCARSMILGKKVNIKLWSEAVKTAAYISNRVITRSLETKSPFEKCFGYAPDIKHMRIFGSTAYLNVPIPQRNKFTTRSRKMMLVGYDEESCNYRLWDKETQRIKISSDVDFYENDDVILDMQVENWMTIKFGDDDEIDKSEPHVECDIKQISDPSENRSDEVVQED